MSSNQSPSTLPAPKKVSAKERMAIQRQSMPEQHATDRAKNFQEVNFNRIELSAAIKEIDYITKILHTIDI